MKFRKKDRATIERSDVSPAALDAQAAGGLDVRDYGAVPNPADAALTARPSSVPGDSVNALMQRLAGELISSTALTRVEQDVGGIRRDLAEFKDNIHGLNTALGDFRDKQISPIRRELANLRYNLGAKVEDTMTSMQKVTALMDKQLSVMLAAQGMSAQQIAAVKEHAGIALDRPSLQELAEHGAKANETLGTAQASESAAAQMQLLLDTVDELSNRVEKAEAALEAERMQSRMNAAAGRQDA